MMHELFNTMPYTGYVYPNETVIPWSILIVVYPYMTGLVAGAFTVSSMYHVFGIQKYKPVARFALLTALCFMLFVPAPLLLHLGHPERAFNAMITPHLTSAFAMFGFSPPSTSFWYRWSPGSRFASTTSQDRRVPTH